MYRQQIIDSGVGFMVVPRSGGGAVKVKWCQEFRFWAADTGLFGGWLKGRFELRRYYERLDTLPRETCLFATAPDEFGDGEATLKMSLDELPRLKQMGFPAAFIIQPGIPEIPWDAFDVLFMGGPDEFKIKEGPALLREAKARGKWCHIGRVNSTKRYLWAREQGYDSADGTHIAFCPTVNSRRVVSWVTSAEQLRLEDAG